MSSVSKTQKSEFWQTHFRDWSGKQISRNTKIPKTHLHRGLAEIVAEFWENIAKQNHSRELLIKRAEMLCETIEAKQDVSEALLILRHFNVKTEELLDQYCPEKVVPSFQLISEQWLALKKLHVADASMVAYSHSIEGFSKFIGENADLPLDEFDREWLRSFQRSEAKRVSNRTVNHKVKHVCFVLRWAYKEDMISINHADKIQHLPIKPVQQRRPFTTEEMKRILNAANPEWKSMIHAGYGTGQRLGDIATMKWSDIDLENNIWNLTAKKSGKKSCLPLLSDFAELLRQVPHEQRKGFVHPEAAQRLQHPLRSRSQGLQNLSSEKEKRQRQTKSCCRFRVSLPSIYHRNDASRKWSAQSHCSRDHRA